MRMVVQYLVRLVSSRGGWCILMTGLLGLAFLIMGNGSLGIYSFRLKYLSRGMHEVGKGLVDWQLHWKVNCHLIKDFQASGYKCVMATCQISMWLLKVCIPSVTCV